MKSIQINRNLTAHHEISEDMVDSAVKLMDDAGKLADWHSLSCVNELKEMWKQLAHMNDKHT